ncbi:uncharacterized protein LOC106868367 isoform X2 [Octopus bimaculoides]|uniref:uncharacterized protein LOC106868367 isoform X2 n=1 Tax=Octopus bimaculoides TaxID=37653 RepID=UPI00071C6E8A|nr:uncharacterized protein LOC106868367 isoform X2 [Octopus bimaculoides]|eukprot:XP_014769073.1 PREDICTED: uncharacterized protein LOC106868367 isoform X2 [Octopus bimaculoides]
MALSFNRFIIWSEATIRRHSIYYRTATNWTYQQLQLCPVSAISRTNLATPFRLYCDHINCCSRLDLLAVAEHNTSPWEAPLPPDTEILCHKLFSHRQTVTLNHRHLLKWLTFRFYRFLCVLPLKVSGNCVKRRNEANMSESSSKPTSAANPSTPTKVAGNNDKDMVDSLGAVDDNLHSGTNNSCKKKKSTAGDNEQQQHLMSREDAGANPGYGNNNNDKPMAGNPSDKTNKQEGRESSTDYISISNIQTWPEYFKTSISLPKSDKDVGEKQSGRSAGDDVKMYSVNPDINKKISLHKGDITKLKVDVIVNAANSSLLGGGGVDGAIHKAAGPELKRKCRTLDGCKTGDIVKTEGYCLPAKYIIHTVGPMGEKAEELRSCYQKSLNSLLKDERTIAFPCISTGVYGYPNDKAAEVSLQTVRKWMESNHEKVDRVIFCIFLPKDVDIYREKMQKYFPLNERKCAATTAEEDKEEPVVVNVESNQVAANAESSLIRDTKKGSVTTQQSYKG